MLLLTSGPPAETRHHRLRGQRALLVDDDWKAVTVLLGLLRDRGMHAMGATTGERAVAMVDTCPPDVVVVALERPGLTGLSLLRRLRQRQPGLPAVIVSGHTFQHEDIVDVLEENAAYVARPIDVGDLLQVLGRLAATGRPALPALRW